ncbi:NADH pyrophosphatase [Sphingomonas sp. Leaf343]|nr:NAD(+) diphosphatase [Sphingomonas sp. Leaf343]KQR80559.1 NADH pyrophosphatase [Sphingomonas sp. Leaf343]
MIGFTGGPLDRGDALRHDIDALAAAKADPRARLLMLEGYTPAYDGDRLAWTALPPDGAELALLGLDRYGVPHFATITGERAQGRSFDLIATLHDLVPGEAATYAGARSLLDWHARHGFCANCGSPTAIFRAGWGRGCPACGTEHFPRVDPVVIMIAEHDDRALLGRQPAFPPGRYSALAGFLEPGESIEEAVAREIGEEAGIAVTDVRYVASQPWPFPSSLMIACTARALDDRITLDTNELEDAIWVSRGEVRAVLAGEKGPFLAPPAYAIAHTLLSAWAEATPAGS